MAAITIYGDFGARKNKVCHCFHCFPIYFPWSDGTRCHDLGFLNRHEYLFYTGVIIQYYFVAQIVPFLAFERAFSWLLIPYSMSQSMQRLFWALYFLALEDTPGSSWIFLAPVLESAISPRSHDFFLFFSFFHCAPRDMWDLSSPSGMKPVPPAVEPRSFNHWTVREVPFFSWRRIIETKVWPLGFEVLLIFKNDKNYFYFLYISVLRLSI